MALDGFEIAEVDERPTNRVAKFENPFPPAVDHLYEQRSAGNPKATLKFDIRRIMKADDESETLAKVTHRARRLLSEAIESRGLKEDVSSEIRPSKDDPWVVLFWLKDPRKPREAKVEDNPVPPVETPAKTTAKK